METAHLMIMDLAPQGCHADHSGKLLRLLHSFPPARAIAVQTTDGLPSETHVPPPDLIVLQSTTTTHLATYVQALRRRWPAVSILGLFCAGMATPTAVYQSLLTGLDDFLCCPIRHVDALPRVQRLLQRKTALQISRPHTSQHCTGLVGESPAFLAAIQRALDVAQTDATVLLSGETGTGKELVARAIHYCSLRQEKPFIPVNCGALPDHLVENELFGHAKGAYTDAASPEKGLVAEAEEGTLFLDEVDTLSTSAQVKLLRFLQDRQYRPLGCARSIHANVRIIAATNADLWQQVQKKGFRDDLYYRLHVVALRLPPLRERHEDIPLLATHFLRHYVREYRRGPLQFSADALRQLVAYTWPGNVRELETIIQRAVILSSNPILGPDDLDLPPSDRPDIAASDSFHEAKTRMIEHFERTYLSQLLALHAGNVTQAAKQAGKERRAFQRLLHKHGLQRCAS